MIWLYLFLFLNFSLRLSQIGPTADFVGAAIQPPIFFMGTDETPRSQANPVACTHQLLRTKDYPSEFEL